GPVRQVVGPAGVLLGGRLDALAGPVTRRPLAGLRPVRGSRAVPPTAAAPPALAAAGRLAGPGGGGGVRGWAAAPAVAGGLRDCVATGCRRRRLLVRCGPFLRNRV